MLRSGNLVCIATIILQYKCFSIIFGGLIFQTDLTWIFSKYLWVIFCSWVWIQLNNYCNHVFRGLENLQTFVSLNQSFISRKLRFDSLSAKELYTKKYLSYTDSSFLFMKWCLFFYRNNSLEVFKTSKKTVYWMSLLKMLHKVIFRVTDHHGAGFITKFLLSEDFTVWDFQKNRMIMSAVLNGLPQLSLLSLKNESKSLPSSNYKEV